MPGDWQWWFAWRPVRTDQGWRWLTTVLRRVRWNGIYGSQNSETWWEYRA